MDDRELLQCEELKQRIHELEIELDETKQLCNSLYDSANEQMALFKNSLSWKITKPIRDIAGAFVKKTGDTLGYLPVSNIRELNKIHGKGSFPNKKEISRQKVKIKSFSRQPKFSILVPLYNTPEKYLKDMLTSVVNQTYYNWELCLADASDEKHLYVEHIVKAFHSKYGERIKYKRLSKNGGISVNTNECVLMSDGDYLCPFDHDDYLHPSVLYYYAQEINKSNADFLYCDEITFSGNNMNDVLSVHFKPDFALYTLLSNNYICHLSAFKRELLENDELYRPEFDGSQDYDMILRMTDKAGTIKHIPKVLYYWRSHEGSTASGIGAKRYAIKAGENAVRTFLTNKGFDGCSVNTIMARDTIYRVKYKISGNPKIHIVVSDTDTTKNKDIYDYIKDNTSYSNIDFNNNINEYKSDEYVVVIKKSVRPIYKNWIDEMLMLTQNEQVGAVGGLINKDNSICSAGIAINSNAPSGFITMYHGDDPKRPGYMARLLYTQNVTALGAGCLMMSVDDYISYVKDPELMDDDSEAIDRCMNLLERGKINLFTPYAVFEDSGERKPMNSRSSQRLRTKWKKRINNDDSYLSASLFDKRIYVENDKQYL
ncbi:glycosyltransferase [Butyrivibrio sp. AE3004]|uniref:glycosyltransferase n=1 Tax=Butyrivibrio sp. AE3004 TaxID=1506994 RepID=UPI000689241E|nr:glycosyltransferase [Butyrivibrio sp. AE3004]